MTFVEFVRKSHFYFKSVKLPPDDTMDIWSEEVGNYPREFYTWAWDAMKAREKKLPDNLPVALKELWAEWLRKNPSRQEHREFSCRQKYCQEGLIFVVKGHESYVFRCGECDSRQDLPLYPISTVSQLRNEGYQSNSVQNTLNRKAEYDPSLWGKTTMRTAYEEWNIGEEAMKAATEGTNG